MTMFNDFDYKSILSNIDTLVRDYKAGSYTEFLDMTFGDLRNIRNVIISKQQEQQLSQAMNSTSVE